MGITADQTLQKKRSVNLKKQQQKSCKTHVRTCTHTHTHTQDQGVKTKRQRELWNDFKYTKIHVPGVPKEEGRTEKTAEELLPKDFPNLMKTLNPQVQKLNQPQAQEI